MSQRLDSAQEDSLDHAFAEYLAAVEAGSSPSREHLVAAHPELAGILEAHEQFDRLTAPLRDLLSGDLSNDFAEPPLPPGTTVGDYELLEVIGHGGMGVVYKARNRKFNLVVALKMLSSSRRATEQQRQRFLAEVENQARLDHPHVVSVTGGGEYQGQLYFTMKLIEGGDLTGIPPGGVSPRRAAEVMVKVARAVHHAHQRSILHRDLKPSNVLLDSEAEPYVADFGLAMFMADEAEEHAGMVGSPAFAPPEQLIGQATTLSDVYGLGTILYWLLTGRRPCEAETLEDTLHKLHQEMPEPPHRLNPALIQGTGRYLDLICLKCLEQRPERRYPSADALAVDLERYLGDVPPLAVPVRRVDRWRLWCKRNPFGAGVASTVFATVLLAVLAAIAIIRSQGESLRAALALVEIQRQSYRQTDEMRQLRNFLLAVAQQPNVPRLFQQRDTAGLQRLCEETYERYESAKPPGTSLVASWFAVGPDLTVWADSTAPGQGTPVADRDYARWAFGAEAGSDVFDSLVYKSRSDGLYKYAVVTRVRDPEDRSRVLGALAASIAPESSRAVESYESFIGEAFAWIAVSLAPLAVLVAAAAWLGLRRARGGRPLGRASSTLPNW